MNDDEILVPTARLTIEYGIRGDGHPIISTAWENLTDHGAPVPMITRAGLIAMEQQSLTIEALDIDGEDTL